MATTIDTSGTVLLRQNLTDVEYSLDNSATWTTALWPVTLNNADTSSTLNVKFISNLTFDSSAQYFIIDSSNITIDGSDNVVNVNVSTNDYPGLVQNGTYSNITIQNIGVESAYSVAQYGGWIGQKYFGNGATHNYVTNCYSTGVIDDRAGGIFGSQSSGSATNCYSIGTIGQYAGGIFGFASSGSASNCYSMGSMGDSAGGIFGFASSGSASNCYSTGPIGVNAGGIFVSGTAGSSATNCYSTGPIGNGGGGIFGPNSQGSAINCYSTPPSINFHAGGIFGFGSSGSATNCYSTGNISDFAGGIFGFASSGSATNCYSTGPIGSYSGGIFAQNSDASANAINCYSIGTIGGSAGGIFGQGSQGSATNCYYTDGSANWLDSAADASLNIASNAWTDIDLNSDTVPYLLSAFTSTLYSTSSGTDATTSGASVLTDFSFSIVSVNGLNPSLYTGITIDSNTGDIAFDLLSLQYGVYEVNVLATNTNDGYSFGTFTNSLPTTIDASGSILVKQDAGSYVQYSIDNSATWTTAVWPVTLNNTDIPNTLTITFTTDLSLNSTDQYFIIDSSNIVIDGLDNVVNIDLSGNGYPGLVRNGTYSYSSGNITANNDAYSDITIQNITLNSNSSSLLAIEIQTNSQPDDSKYCNGWICQAYFGLGGSNNNVDNCSSNGSTFTTGYTYTIYWIDSNGNQYNTNVGTTIGGCILGDFCNADVTNCYSTGDIGFQAGGIFGVNSSGSATNCYSTGTLGNGAGGIFGAGASAGSSATSCYSTGTIDPAAGGIFGQNSNNCSASNCYSIGDIGQNAGGIFGQYSQSGSSASNCYSIGNINGNGAGGVFGGNTNNCSAINCYSTGTIGSEAGGIFGSTSQGSATNCYSTGNYSTNNGKGIGTLADASYCYATDGSTNWLDSNADASLNIASNAWTDIDLTATNVPYLLSSFTGTLYSPDSATNASKSGISIVTDFSFSIVSVNGLNPLDYSGITIDENTGDITFDSLSLQNGVYEVNVLATNTNNGYSFGTFTDTVTAIETFVYQFDCTNVVDQNTIATYLPVLNNNSSITIDGITVTNTVSNTYRVSINYSYNSVSGTDGLTFNVSTNVFDYYNNTNGASGVSNLIITDLGGIPISTGGSQFDGLTTLISFNSGTSAPYIGSNASFNSMFYNCVNLTQVTFSNTFDTTNVTNMGLMFSNCSSLTSLDLTNFITTNVTNMGRMFNNCYSLTSLDVTNFITTNVTIMDAMFSACFRLTSLDLSNFNTSNVTIMNSMFEMTDNQGNTQDSSLNTITFGQNFDPSACTNMANMFYYCNNLTTVQHKDISNNTVEGIDNWNTSNVTNMTSMFEGTSSLTTIGDVYTNWVVTNVGANHVNFSLNSLLTNIPNFTDVQLDASGTLFFQLSGSDVEYSTSINGPWTIASWPITVKNIDTLNTLTISFINDLSFNSVQQYFILDSSNITIDGSNNVVNVNVSTNDYPGLIQNGTSYSNGNSYITIQNLGLVTTYSVVSHGGWIGQSNFGKNATDILVTNCYSTGNMSESAGGILGSYSSGLVTNCYSTGNINQFSGGIFGSYSSGSATNCYSTGTTDTGAGGIFGSDSQVGSSATNCYSIGSIGTESGGIFGEYSYGSASDCYSTGTISRNAGGIFGYNGQAISTATNCYSTGHITGTDAGGIFGYQCQGTATNCYSTGVIDASGQGIGGLDPSYCYYTDGSANWLDASANASLNISGTVWTDIDLSSLTVPYLLSSFTTTLYDPSSVSNAATINATTTNSKLTGYNNWSICSICNNDPPSEYPGISINSNSGELDCSSSLINGAYTINVLAQNSSGGYYFGNVLNTISGRAEPSYDSGTTNPPTDAVVENVGGTATVATNNTGLVVKSLTSAYATVAVGTGGSATVNDVSEGNISVDLGASVNILLGTPSAVSGAGTLTLGQVTLYSANLGLTGITNISGITTSKNSSALGTSRVNLKTGSSFVSDVAGASRYSNTFTVEGETVIDNIGSDSASFSGSLEGSGNIVTKGITSFSDITNFYGELNTFQNSDTTFGSSAPNASVSQGANSSTKIGTSSLNRSIAPKIFAKKSVKSSINNLTYDSYTVAGGATIDITDNGINVTNDFTVDGSATIIDPGFANSIDISGSLIINNDSVLTISVDSESLTEGTFNVFTFSDLSGGSDANFAIDISGTSTQFMVNGELGTNSYIVTVSAIAPCFLAGTPIVTNQGIIDIDNIDPSRHTIRNKKIVAVTKTIIPHKYLVQIEKNALGKNMPSERTIISQNHIIFYKGKEVKAKDFVNVFADVKKIPYKGEVLYNVLLEEHDKMMVNNLICETLHPDNMVAILFKQFPNLSAEQLGEILFKLNNQFLKNKKGDTKVVLRI